MKIMDWDKWQTYRKDRGTPPWIKVHRNLMTNPEWAILSDAEKGQLVSMWIIAADKNGEIPDCPKVLRKVCMLDNDPNINKFIELGFLSSSGCHVVVTVASSGCQRDAPETETETETETNTICRFDEWWTTYPKKVGKKTVRAIWKRRKLDEVAEILISDVNRRLAQDRKWAEGFIPNPATYLNGDRWEDEIEEVKSNGTHQKDNRSRAKQFSDKLDEIARRSLEEESASRTLDIGDIQEAPGEVWPQMDIGHGGDRGGGSR